jgi:ProP effector
MSNLTLKEQLQALSLVGSAELNGKSQKSPNPHTPQKSLTKSAKANKQKPAWLEYAQYGVELLKAHFPLCFKDIKEIQPLKVGIKQDLVKALGAKEDIAISDKACMVTSLAYYVNSASYHKNIVAGAVRIDLNGEAAGVVTAEEANYSAECRQAKLIKKKPSQNEIKTEATETVT